MSIPLQHDSLKVADAISEGTSINWWLWILAGILVLAVILFFPLRKKKYKPVITSVNPDTDTSKEIDFKNIVKSAFHAKALYDELKIKCHPDRFPTDPQKNAIAERLFQEIAKNKNNIKRLNELKEEAIQTLNINFKSKQV